MALATSSISGLISGMDTATIIQQLMAIERRPIDKLQQQVYTAQSQKTALETVNTSLLALKTAVDQLARASTWMARTVSVSAPGVLSATATDATPVGSYTFTVTQLAAAGQLASGGFADADTAPVGAGGFDLTVGPVTETIAVGAADTLRDVAEKINAKAMGVTAAVVNTGSGTTPWRLVLTSRQTGIDNAVAVSNNTSGLTFTEITAARNATIQFGQDSPIAVESATNTVTGLAGGLSLQLTAVSASPVTVTVVEDTAGLLEKAREFAKAFNAVQENISKTTGYSVEQEQAGVLFGNNTLRFIASDLARAAGDSVDGVDESVNSLAMVGFALKANGQLELDEAAFSRALETGLAGVTALFSSVLDRALSSAGATAAGPAAAAGFGVGGLIDGNADPDDFGAGSGFQSLNTIAADGGAHVFTVNFGSLRSVSQLQLFTLDGGQGVSDFGVELQTADGSWQSVAAAAGFTGTLWSDMLFDPVSAQAMRVTVTGTNAPDGLTRLLEFGAVEKVGVAQRLAGQLAFVTRGVDGAIASEQSALDERIGDMQTHIEALEERLTAKEERLRAQFTAMEMALAQMQSQSNFFLSQLASLPASNG